MNIVVMRNEKIDIIWYCKLSNNNILIIIKFF